MNFYKKFDLLFLLGQNRVFSVKTDIEIARYLTIALLNTFFQYTARRCKLDLEYQRTNCLYRLADLDYFARPASAVWLEMQVFSILIIGLNKLASEYCLKVLKNLMSNNLKD